MKYPKDGSQAAGDLNNKHQHIPSPVIILIFFMQEIPSC